MKYMATLNGKNYEVELERIDDYQPLPRNGEAAEAPAPIKAPAAPKAVAPTPAAAPVPVAATPAPAAAPAPAPAAGGNSTTVESPMPGKVLDIKVSAGQAVKFGQVLVTMEAMKMETEIVAPADGTVTSVVVKSGDAVETGAAMVILN